MAQTRCFRSLSIFSSSNRPRIHLDRGYFSYAFADTMDIGNEVSWSSKSADFLIFSDPTHLVKLLFYYPSNNKYTIYCTQ